MKAKIRVFQAAVFDFSQTEDHLIELNQKEINGRIGLLMQRLGKNQKQFAGLLGVTQPAVSKYLTVRIPPPAVLLKLARLTGTSIEWILCGDIFFTGTRVAETESSYNPVQTTDDKISLLPVPLQKQVIALLDTLIAHLPK